MTIASNPLLQNHPHAQLDGERQTVTRLIRAVAQAGVRAEAISIVNFYVALKSKPLALLTGPAPGTLRGLHPRAPILVAPAHFDAWLDPALEHPARLRALLGNELAEALAFRPVDPRVNDPRFDDPACLEASPQLSLL